MMDKPVLFVNACVRQESRTEKLAMRLFRKMGMPYEEVRLEAVEFPIVNENFLRMRDRLVGEGNFAHEIFALARRFAEAEMIVVAAPYWDLSFPAALKQYFEQVSVVGITFRYAESGVPVGLCRAKKLFYVTTIGGDFAPEDYGFGYVRALAQGYYGIEDVALIRACGLDLVGADVEEIMRAAEHSIDKMDV